MPSGRRGYPAVTRDTAARKRHPARTGAQARDNRHVQLSGAVAVVTGATAGIGRATVRELRGRGAHVVAVGRDEAALASLTEEYDVTPVCLDLRADGAAEQVVAAALDRHGRLDVAVANAGVGHAGSVATMTAECVDELLAVNVRAPVQLARAALPTMLAQGRGALVFVSSIAGALLVPGETVYSATKAAVEGFAEPLREELRGTGVTVSTVLPGVVATGFFDRRGTPYDRRFPRPIRAERVATAVAEAAVSGRARVVVPRWLAVPIRLRGAAPGLYRAMSRRLG